MNVLDNCMYSECIILKHIFRNDLSNTLLGGNWGTLEKKEEIWLSPMTKAHKPTEKSKKQRDNTKNAIKITPPITQRLRTDIGRSVKVTTAIPLVWINRLN